MADKVSPEEAQRLMGPLGRLADEPSEVPSAPEASHLPPEKGMEIFGPEPEELKTSIGNIRVSPMVMKQIRSFMVHAEKLLPMVQGMLENGGEINITQLIAADDDAFMKSIAAAVSVPADKLDELLPDEFIRVVTKVVVVNLDFFVRTLPQVLGGAKMSVFLGLKRLAQVGQEQSKALSKKAIA